MSQAVRDSAPSPNPIRSANVRRWLVGLAVSLVGDQVFYIALGWAAVRATDPGTAGLILAAGAVPRAVLMLAGGVVVDRLGARLIVVVSDAARLVTMVLVAGFLLWRSADVVVLVVVSVVFGVADALFQPAIGSLPPRLVPADQLLRLQGLRAFAYRAAAIAGAPLGGFFVAGPGLPTAFLFNGATFAISLAAVCSLRLRPVERADVTMPSTTFTRDLVGGLRQALVNPLIAPTIGIVFFVELGLSGSLTIGLPLLATRNEWHASGLGILVAGFGVGAACAALATAATRRAANGAAFTSGGLVAAAATTTLASLPNPWLAAIATAVLGAAAALMTSTALAIVQSTTEVTHLGRVMSLFGLASTGSVPFANALTGWATDHSSLHTALLINAAITATAAVIALASRPIRRYRG